MPLDHLSSPGLIILDGLYSLPGHVVTWSKQIPCYVTEIPVITELTSIKEMWFTWGCHVPPRKSAIRGSLLTVTNFDDIFLECSNPLQGALFDMTVLDDFPVI